MFKFVIELNEIPEPLMSSGALVSPSRGPITGNYQLL